MTLIIGFIISIFLLYFGFRIRKYYEIYIFIQMIIEYLKFFRKKWFVDDVVDGVIKKFDEIVFKDFAHNRCKYISIAKMFGFNDFINFINKLSKLVEEYFWELRVYTSTNNEYIKKCKELEKKGIVIQHQTDYEMYKNTNPLLQCEIENLEFLGKRRTDNLSILINVPFSKFAVELNEIECELENSKLKNIVINFFKKYKNQIIVLLICLIVL